MYNTEEFTAVAHANINATLALSRSAFDTAERLAALHMGVARGMLEESLAGARALFSAKDMHEVITVQGALAQPVLDKAVAYSGGLIELGTEAREEFGRIVEGHVAQLKTKVAGAFDKAARGMADATAVPRQNGTAKAKKAA